MPALRKTAAIAALALTIGGCGLFDSTPPGTVTGVVLFNGGPAHGIRVSLLNANLPPTETDVNGRYTFTNVPAGQGVQVSFVSRQDNAAAAADQFPNEVYQWTSAPVDPGGGADLPPFDISYDGLLYPDDTMALLSGPSAPIPFHWSTQLSATHYRLHVVSRADNSQYTGDWTSDPMAVFAQAVTPGKYDWYVEFDGGDRGTGRSWTREVDLSPVGGATGTGGGS